MLKLIFNKDVNFKKKCDTPKVKTFRMARHILILCLSTMNLIIYERNGSHIYDIKLSKYCYIDARLLYNYQTLKMARCCRTVTLPLIRSATSIRQLGHHVVSTIESHRHHPDCCCIRVS